MPSLAELRKQKLKDQKESKTQSEEKIIPESEKISAAENLSGVRKDFKSIARPKEKNCPSCNKRNKIIGEKLMNKNDIINWFQVFLDENEKNLPLDWLRGQKLTFESVNEMRK